MDVTVLLDEDVIEDVIGDSADRVLLYNGGIGQGLVVGQLHALVVKVEAAAHPAAVQAGVAGNALEVLKNFVPGLLVEVFRRRGSVVEAELNGGPRDLLEPLQIGNQIFSGIVLIQHAVYPEGHRQLGKQAVIGLHHIFLHVAGDVDAGDLVLVPLREGQDVLLRLERGYRQGGVDIDLMGGGNLVQHTLQGLQVGKGFTAGEDEITVRSDGVHPADAGPDLLCGEAGQIRVFAFIDAERAVVFAVVGDEDGHGRAALPRLVGMVHNVSPFRL